MLRIVVASCSCVVLKGDIRVSLVYFCYWCYFINKTFFRSSHFSDIARVLQLAMPVIITVHMLHKLNRQFLLFYDVLIDYRFVLSSVY